MWKWRNLSLLGKIKIVKTFAIPKLMFRASVTLISSDVVQEANSIFYNFIWKSKNAVPVTNPGYCYFPLFHFSFWEAKNGLLFAIVSFALAGKWPKDTYRGVDIYNCRWVKIENWWRKIKKCINHKGIIWTRMLWKNCQNSSWLSR